MIDDRKICILRNSCNVFNKFSINNSNRLIHEEIKDGEVVSQNEIAEDIKDYSVDIDSEDKIHIIYTSDNINLKYLVLPQNNNIVNIASAKRNLSLRCISIKTSYANPYIFFTLTDVQHNNHIICQSSFIKGCWQSKEIFKAMGPRYIQPYLLEIHNKEIYMLLCLSHSEGKLALYRMNNLSCEWSDVGRDIELKNRNNVTFFISPKNIVIISYNKLINRNIQTIIIYRSLEMKIYEVWRKIILSDKDSNTLKPSIFFNKEEYYITWVQGDEVVLKRSKDLIYWEDVFTFDKSSSDYIKCCYKSNNFQDSDLKMNSTYLSNTINSYPFINLNFKTELPKEYISIKSGQSDINSLEEKDCLEEKISPEEEKPLEEEEPLEEWEPLEEQKPLVEKIPLDEKIPLVEKIPRDDEKPLEELISLKEKEFLEEKIMLLDKELKKKTRENDLMKKNINYLKNIISEYEEHIKGLNNAQIFPIQNITIHKKDFLDKTLYYQKEKDTLLFSYNDKLWKLLRLIEKKDKLINDLYKSINK